MKQSIFEIISNESIACKTYKMILSGDTSQVTKPGQFVNIKIEGFSLRRPISICDCKNGKLTLIYKTVGAGTEKMSRMKQGESLDLLTGLGNGYSTQKGGNEPLLIGGGLGVPPLFLLCRSFTEKGIYPAVILGFNSEKEIFYEEEFRSLGAKVFVATADGSYGQKGFVTDVMRNLKYSFFYACGPLPMYKAIEKIAVTGGEYSLEERMGCGFGACMGCSIMTKNGPRRVCKDGPVFEREELIWQKD